MNDNKNHETHERSKDEARERRPYEPYAMTESERAERQAEERKNMAAKALRREYKRQYDRANRQKNAEYAKKYWRQQLDVLDEELGHAEAHELRERLKSAAGDTLAEIIEQALERVDKKPSAFANFDSASRR